MRRLWVESLGKTSIKTAMPRLQTNLIRHLEIIMTPAEYKTLRESLCLSTQWVADQSGIDAKACKQWESHQSTVPTDISQLLLHIEDLVSKTSQSSINHIIKTAESGKTGMVVMIRYQTDEDLWRFVPSLKPLPTSTHGSILSRVRQGLSIHNIRTKIAYMVPDDYTNWLGERDDVESLRLEWATQSLKSDA